MAVSKTNSKNGVKPSPKSFGKKEKKSFFAGLKIGSKNASQPKAKVTTFKNGNNTYVLETGIVSNRISRLNYHGMRVDELPTNESTPERALKDYKNRSSDNLK